MKIAARYSFNKGAEEVNARFPDPLPEVTAAIANINAAKYRTKKSAEKTKRGQMLYSPISLNKAF